MLHQFTSSAELHSLRVLLDPYPFYHWLRAREPVHWSEPLGLWIVTGYREVSEALLEPQLSSRIDIVSPDLLDAESRAECRPLFDLQRRWMQQSDPPEHTAIRGPWTRLFCPATAQDVESETVAFANAAVRTGIRAGGFDVIALFADLPAIVLGRVLGLDRNDLLRFRPWIEDIVAFRHHPSAAAGRRALASLSSWRAAFAETIARSKPLTALVDDQGEEQLFATVTSLMAGRYEPTIGLIGNGTLALLANPDQQPHRMGAAFDLDAAIREMLRFDCPFQSAVRLAREPVRIGERDIRAGDRILLLLGAANRDPRRFCEPDSFRVDRTDGGHVAFGAGRHACLGFPLAQMIVRAAFHALLERLPSLAIAARRPDWFFDAIGYRALRSLSVVVT